MFFWHDPLRVEATPIDTQPFLDEIHTLLSLSHLALLEGNRVRQEEISREIEKTMLEHDKASKAEVERRKRTVGNFLKIIAVSNPSQVTLHTPKRRKIEHDNVIIAPNNGPGLASLFEDRTARNTYCYKFGSPIPEISEKTRKWKILKNVNCCYHKTCRDMERVKMLLRNPIPRGLINVHMAGTGSSIPCPEVEDILVHATLRMETISEDGKERLNTKIGGSTLAESAPVIGDVETFGVVRHKEQNKTYLDNVNFDATILQVEEPISSYESEVKKVPNHLNVPNPVADGLSPTISRQSSLIDRVQLHSFSSTEHSLEDVKSSQEAEPISPPRNMRKVRSSEGEWHETIDKLRQQVNKLKELTDWEEDDQDGDKLEAIISKTDRSKQTISLGASQQPAPTFLTEASNAKETRHITHGIKDQKDQFEQPDLHKSSNKMYNPQKYEDSSDHFESEEVGNRYNFPGGESDSSKSPVATGFNPTFSTVSDTNITYFISDTLENNVAGRTDKESESKEKQMTKKKAKEKVPTNVEANMNLILIDTCTGHDKLSAGEMDAFEESVRTLENVASQEEQEIMVGNPDEDVVYVVYDNENNVSPTLWIDDHNGSTTAAQPPPAVAAVVSSELIIYDQEATDRFHSRDRFDESREMYEQFFAGGDSEVPGLFYVSPSNSDEDLDEPLDLEEEEEEEEEEVLEEEEEEEEEEESDEDRYANANIPAASQSAPILRSFNTSDLRELNRTYDLTPTIHSTDGQGNAADIASRNMGNATRCLNSYVFTPPDRSGWETPFIHARRGLEMESDEDLPTEDEVSHTTNSSFLPRINNRARTGTPTCSPVRASQVPKLPPITPERTRNAGSSCNSRREIQNERSPSPQDVLQFGMTADQENEQDFRDNTHVLRSPNSRGISRATDENDGGRDCNRPPPHSRGPNNRSKSRLNTKTTRENSHIDNHNVSMQNATYLVNHSERPSSRRSSSRRGSRATASGSSVSQNNLRASGSQEQRARVRPGTPFGQRQKSRLRAISTTMEGKRETTTPASARTQEESRPESPVEADDDISNESPDWLIETWEDTESAQDENEWLSHPPTNTHPTPYP